MNNKKIKIILILLLILIVALLVIVYIYINKDSNNVEIKTESTQLHIEYSDEELTGEWSDYNAKISLYETKVAIEGSGVTNNENEIVINSSGTYYITGILNNGNILIQADKNDDVQLVLDNVSITSSQTAPINCTEANKLTITLADDSENTISDNDSYTKFTDTESSEPDGTVFSKADLVINGKGKLIVNANYADGIVSKDGLKIINSNIEINSEDDGIRVKDYVAINNANINIKSKGDGIKSTNDSDVELGYIAIEGGQLSIDSEEDGIQAETILNISSDSTINVTTNGEIETSSGINENFGFEPKGSGYSFSNSNNSTEDSISSKGIKAGAEITIDNGNIKINSTDDSIHSNGIIIINNGNINLASGDDGIHADTNIVINGGDINITKSYEGIESSYIEINSGVINIISSDDGINISGGNDSSSLNNRVGQNSFSTIDSSQQKLVINDGNITVNANGDGLDANGSIYINNGNIVVAGPSSSGNGALDYDSECIITGGNIIIYGSSGMWQNPSNTSTQYCLTFQTSGKSGDNVVLKDSSGNEVVSFTTEKTYGVITISNSNIEKGKTYTLYINENEVSNIEVNSIINSNSSMGGNGMQQQMREPGGGMQQKNKK